MFVEDELNRESRCQNRNIDRNGGIFVGDLFGIGIKMVEISPKISSVKLETKMGQDLTDIKTGPWDQPLFVVDKFTKDWPNLHIYLLGEPLFDRFQVLAHRLQEHLLSLVKHSLIVVIMRYCGFEIYTFVYKLLELGLLHLVSSLVFFFKRVVSITSSTAHQLIQRKKRKDTICVALSNDTCDQPKIRMNNVVITPSFKIGNGWNKVRGTLEH
ncbi:hypothetical protein ACSBR2_015508 [Camellia fascicularis]